jgi:hypothetical protein
MKRIGMVAIMMLAGLAAALVLAVAGGGPLPASAQATASTATPGPTATRIPAYTVVFLRQEGPHVPTLREIISDSADETAALDRVVAYFTLNRERLAEAWRETHPDRLKALYAMIVTHISLPYGATTFPASLLEFASQEYAHCGTYTFAQVQIAHALGLTYRVIEFVGEHAWLEVRIDGQWEIFDATTDTWLSGGVEDMLAGAAREYAYYYTPLLDIDHPEARLHFALGYDMQRLRQRMPLLGVSYFPPGEQIIGQAVIPAGA